MTADECLEVVVACARGDSVSPTQLRAAIYLLERAEAAETPVTDDWSAIYGDSNVTPLKSAG